MLSLYIVYFNRGSSFPDFAVISAKSISQALNIAKDDVLSFWGKGVYVTKIEEYDKDNAIGIVALGTQCC